MQFTCEVYFDTADRRSYEWEIAVCAPTFSDAARIIEQRVLEKVPGSTVREVNVQIPHVDFVEKMEKESGGKVGIVFEHEPVEQRRPGPSPLKKLAAWLRPE
jgi:hypothetical protein